jgi:nucleoside-diphosphate-sugar epimerase
MNIGNPDELSVREVAERVVALTNSKSRIEYHPLPEDDPKVRRPDISLARRILQWEATVSLAEGLEKTIPYFRKLVDERGSKARPFFHDEPAAAHD